MKSSGIIKFGLLYYKIRNIKPSDMQRLRFKNEAIRALEHIGDQGETPPYLPGYL
jgi:hypothetical protein